MYHSSLKKSNNQKWIYGFEEMLPRLMKDHLGSTRAVFDNTGQVVEARDYYPFGLEMPGRTHTGGNPNPVKEKFTGKERDWETGWDYFGARYYDPAIARWLAVDPLSNNHPSFSPFVYCANNPLIFIDPNGKDWLKALGHAFGLYSYIEQGSKGVGLAIATSESGIGIGIGIGIAAHGIFGAGCEYLNMMNEVHESITGNYYFNQKLPSGLFEFLAMNSTDNDLTIGLSAILDISVNMIAGNGISRATAVALTGKYIDILSNVKSMSDLIDKIEQIIKEYNNGESNQNQQTEKPKKKKDEPEKPDKPDKPKKKKNDNSNWDGWGPMNQGPPQ